MAKSYVFLAGRRRTRRDDPTSLASSGRRKAFRPNDCKNVRTQASWLVGRGRARKQLGRFWVAAVARSDAAVSNCSASRSDTVCTSALLVKPRPTSSGVNCVAGAVVSPSRS